MSHTPVDQPPATPVRPAVSIGITTYNRAHLVTRAIDSVLAQDYAPLRLVVVDDASTDDTAAVLARYASDPRVTIIALPINGGIPVAKNAALDALTGEYGALLDSDDALLPGAVGVCVRALEQRGEGVSQVFAHCLDSVSGGFTGYTPNGSGPVTYEDALADRIGGEHWNMFRLSDLASLRFHPEALTSETLVWHQMLRAKPAVHLGVPLRTYHKENTDRISVAEVSPRVAHGRMMAYRAYLDALGDDVRRVSPPRFAMLALELAKWEARCGHRVSAVRTLARAALAGRPPGFWRAAAVVGMPRALHGLAYRVKDSR